ncbi:MAG TPA: hypothetical protein VMG82_27860 [Candidatus Sulfotelmatobacter sp.]|nr:hypothetical protein [Candidatus Sulfotelmatobacter sp.]
MKRVIAAAALDNFSGNRAVWSKSEVASPGKLVRLGLGKRRMNKFTACLRY